MLVVQLPREPFKERMTGMFQKGQYVNYGKHGVCLVEDITHMDIP